MPVLTLAEARTAVASHLDDPNNVRWSTADLDRGLATALAACLSDYASAGGDAFDVEVSASSASGVVDLTSSAPLLVRAVQVQDSGGAYWTLRPAMLQDRVEVDSEATRTVKVVVVRDYTLPSTTSHPLVGNGATAAPSWLAFDQWVCAEAALFCGIKDNDRRPGLQALAEKMRANVLGRINTPRSRPLRLPRHARWDLAQALHYVWAPTTSRLTLINTRAEAV